MTKDHFDDQVDDLQPCQMQEVLKRQTVSYRKLTDNGTVTLTPGWDVIGPSCKITIRDINRPAGIVLTDPDGKTYTIPLVVKQDGSGTTVSY